MATITASSAASEAPSAQSTRPLWQAPLFVVGVGALLFVSLARPTLGSVSGRRLDRELAAIRKLLTRPDGDMEEVLHRASALLEMAQRTGPDHVGEAHLLIGIALVRLSDGSTADRAATNWRAARTHLEEAEHLGVPDGDRAHLQFYLLKALANTGEPVDHVLARLKKIEPADEDREAYYRLLRDLFLQMSPPDLAAALDANTKMRTSVAESHLAEAQLRSGELLLRLGRPEDARKDLEMIGAQAPAAIRIRALLLRGQSFQSQKPQDWMHAAGVWQQILNETTADLPERPRIQYDLGLCYWHLGQPADRDTPRLWEECVRTAHGDEGAAAALGLAELFVTSDNPAKAVENAARAVRDVRRPEEWKNTLIDLAGAKERFESVVKGLRDAKRFDLAVQAAQSYQRLAPTEAGLLAAESSVSWAQQRREAARQLSDEAKRIEEEQAARDLFRKAGDAFTQASAGASAEDLLWKAAGCYADAGDEAKQQQTLRRCLESTTKKERKAEICYLLAESLRRQGKDKEADEAYRSCIQEKEEPFVSRALYQLAMLMMARGEVDDARDVLEQTLKNLRNFRDGDTQEKTLFALGKLFYQRREYRMAATRLEEVLSHVTAGPEALKARLLLASSYRQLASQERQNELLSETGNPKSREFYQGELRRWLEKAAMEYHDLRLALEQPENHGILQPAEETQVSFLEAECWFDHGGKNRKYEEAIALYTQLAQRYAGSVEGLNAQGGLVRCYSARCEPGDAEKVKLHLGNIREALKNVDASVRGPWEEWLTVVSKPTS
jgi:TolA-binding protein